MSYLSFLGGISAKMYDDLNDNPLLHKFKHHTFMELLKGVHFISFTAISIHDPLFFIISYVANFLHYLGNLEGYSDAYEHSLIYSFMLLFFILDYRKINHVNLIDTLLMMSVCVILLIEPILMRYYFQNSEYSYQKMIIRILLCILTMFTYVMATSPTVQHLFTYFIGYGVFSVMVQYYSLMNQKEKEKEIEKEKEEKIKEEKEKEEEKEEEEKEEEEKEETRKLYKV